MPRRERIAGPLSLHLESYREEAALIVKGTRERAVVDKRLDLPGYLHGSNWSAWENGSSNTPVFRMACVFAAMSRAGLSRADVELHIRFLQRVRDDLFPLEDIDPDAALVEAQRADTEEDLAESIALLDPARWAEWEAAKEREIATGEVALEARRHARQLAAQRRRAA